LLDPICYIPPYIVVGPLVAQPSATSTISFLKTYFTFSFALILSEHALATVLPAVSLDLVGRTLLSDALLRRTTAVWGEWGCIQA